LFETFAAEYSTSYLNENQEMKELEAVIVKKDKQLQEATEKSEANATEVEVQKAKIGRINESNDRKDKLVELMKPLANKQADVMTSLLESVTTDKLQSAYDKYLPAVLKDEAPKKAILTEHRKEVTGNKTKPSQSEDESNIILLQKLAGM
jgi:kynureninase